MGTRIRFTDSELKEVFKSLKFSDERLYKEINNALDNINRDPHCGRNAQKKLIPRELAIKHNLRNLWIYNLRKDWRLLYTLSGDDIGIIAIVLDWMDHHDYEKLFRFG